MYIWSEQGNSEGFSPARYCLPPTIYIYIVTTKLHTKFRMKETNERRNRPSKLRTLHLRFPAVNLKTVACQCHGGRVHPAGTGPTLSTRTPRQHTPLPTIIPKKAKFGVFNRIIIRPLLAYITTREVINKSVFGVSQNETLLTFPSTYSTTWTNCELQ